MPYRNGFREHGSCVQPSVQEVRKRNVRVLGRRFNRHTLIRILGTEKKRLISRSINGRKEKKKKKQQLGHLPTRRPLKKCRGQRTLVPFPNRRILRLHFSASHFPSSGLELSSSLPMTSCPSLLAPKLKLSRHSKFGIKGKKKFFTFSLIF